MLIVLVVLGHIFEYSVSDWNHNILQNLIWAVQMPGFMLVSGYFSFRDVKKMLVGYRKSVERYLLPFLTWFVLISVLLLGNYEHNVLTGLNRLAWRVDRGLWFIWVVFVLSLIMGLCNLIRSKVNGFVKQLVAVAITVGGMLWNSACCGKTDICKFPRNQIHSLLWLILWTGLVYKVDTILLGRAEKGLL